MPRGSTCCRRCTLLRAENDGGDAAVRAAIEQRTASPRRARCPSAARSSSISKARSAMRFRRSAAACIVHCSTQHPSEMQHLVAHALQLHAHDVHVECRRMGGGFGGKESQSAIVRVRGGGGCGQAAPPGQAAARPRRRFPDHRPPARLLVRLRSRLRRRGPRAGRAHRHGQQRGAFGRPVRAGDDAGAVPFRQCVLAAERRHARVLGPYQHAEQHRIPRLRRPPGRDRDREHSRLDRAQAGHGSARRPQGQLLRQGGAQRHAVRADGVRQHRA